MSDVSVLSNQYEMLINTSGNINNAIITLKKSWLKKNHRDNKYQELQLSEEEVEKSTAYLDHFLEELDKLLESVDNHSTDIPNSIESDYVERLQEDTPNVKEDIKKIRAVIHEKQGLDNTHLKTLDSILMTLDGERKVLFRKLRSSRE